MQGQGTKSKKVIIEATKDNKKPNAVQRHEQKNNIFDKSKSTKRGNLINCKYCGNSLIPRRCPAYAEMFMI